MRIRSGRTFTKLLTVVTQRVLRVGQKSKKGFKGTSAPSVIF